jgi:hypothetical protein
MDSTLTVLSSTCLGIAKVIEGQVTLNKTKDKNEIYYITIA